MERRRDSLGDSARAAVGDEFSSGDFFGNSQLDDGRVRPEEHKRPVSENVVLEGDMFKVVLQDEVDSDFELNLDSPLHDKTDGDILKLDVAESDESNKTSLANESEGRTDYFVATSEQFSDNKGNRETIEHVVQQEHNEPLMPEDGRRAFPCVSDSHSSSNQRSSLFELAFLQNEHRTELSSFTDGADTLLTASDATKAHTGVTSLYSVAGKQNGQQKYHLPSCSGDLFKPSKTISSDVYLSGSTSDNQKTVRAGLFEKFLTRNSASSWNVFVDEHLKGDAKLWCQTYVKLVDCANLLLLTIPKSLTVPHLENKLHDSSMADGSFLAADSSCQIKSLKKVLVSSASADICNRSCSSEQSSNLFDDSDSLSETGHKRGRQRSKKAAETKLSKAAKPTFRRRMIIVGSSSLQKTVLNGEQDEVICKLDAWKKLHKSKARKKSSKNSEPVEKFSNVTVKQEVFDDFDSLVFRNECPTAEPNVSESLPVIVKSEAHVDLNSSLLSSDSLVYDSCNTDISQTVITVEPKTEIMDGNFVFIKQEPIDDFCYADNVSNSTIGQNFNAEFSVCKTMATDCFGVNPMSSETSCDRYPMLQDKRWQPTVILKQFPIWILQNLPSSENNFNYSEEQPAEDETSKLALNSFESLTEDSPDSIFLSGYSLRCDDQNQFDLPADSTSHISDSCLGNELAQKRDAPSSDDTMPPRAKRSRPSSTSKTRSCNARKRRIRLDYDDKDSLTDSVGLLTDSRQQQTEPPPVESRRSFEPASRGRGRGRGRGRRKSDIMVQPLEPTTQEHRDINKLLDIATPSVVSDESGNARGMVRRGSENARRKRGRCRSTRNLHDSGNSRLPSTDSGSEKLAEEKNTGQEIKDDANELPHEINNSKTLKAESSGKLQRSDCDTKLPKPSRELREKTAKYDKVRSTKQPPPPRPVEEKKPPPKVGFVIPKKKPQVPDAPSKPCQQSMAPKLNSAINSLPRIPRIKKLLSDEDKERSVLAKLEKVSDKKPDSGWDMKCVRPCTVSGKMPENFADHHGGPAAQDRPKDLNRPRMETNRFRIQSPTGNCRFPSGPSSSSSMPKKPPVITVHPCTPTVNTVSRYRASQAMGSRSSIGHTQVEFHNRQTYARPQEQHPLPSVGSNIPVIHSGQWAAASQTDCASDAPGKWGAETQTKDRSNPVLREVPFVDDPYESFSGSCDDDIEDDCFQQRGVLSDENLIPLASAPSQSLQILEETTDCDSSDIDDGIRLLVEAVQEAVTQGNVSPSKCTKLRNLYDILRQDLETSGKSTDRSRDADGLTHDAVRRSISSKFNYNGNHINKGMGDSTSSAASKSRDHEVRAWLEADSVKRDVGRSLKTDDIEKSSLSSNRNNFRSTQAVRNVAFDDLTYKTLKLLEDETSWQNLLAQAEDLSISEQHLELIRRLLLDAAKKGVCDEKLASMVNEACHHIRNEHEGELLMSKRGAESRKNTPNRSYSEDVEIPFLTQEKHGWDGTNHRGTAHSQEIGQISERSRTSSTAQSHLNEPSDLGGLNVDLVDDDKSFSETSFFSIEKQELIVSKIVDEMQLLDMLVAIQIELSGADESEPPNVADGQSVAPRLPLSGRDPRVSSCAESDQNNCDLVHESAENTTSGSEPNLLAGDKTSSDTCDVRSIASDTTPCVPGTSVIGGDTQDSSSSKRSANEEEVEANNKKSVDPKITEEKVISLARNALKPHYHNGVITSDEFKLIMKKAIGKICKSRSNDISQKRVAKFINAYVEKIIQSRHK